jgi:hypothetical protein
MPTDRRHRISGLAAFPLVGKAGTGCLNVAQKIVKNQHIELESEIQAQGNQKIQVPKQFRIAGDAPKRLFLSKNRTSIR